MIWRNFFLLWDFSMLSVQITLKNSWIQLQRIATYPKVSFSRKIFDAIFSLTKPRRFLIMITFTKHLWNWTFKHIFPHTKRSPRFTKLQKNPLLKTENRLTWISKLSSKTETFRIRSISFEAKFTYTINFFSFEDV